MNITEQTIKGLQENQETAIKLLEENVELKKRIKRLEDGIVELSKEYDNLLKNMSKLLLKGDKNE